MAWRRPRLGFCWYLTEVVALFALALVICYLCLRPDDSASLALAKDVVIPFTSVVFGAIIAFHLERKKKQDDDREAKKIRASIAYYKLVRLLNRLANLSRQCVDPYRKQPGRSIAIPAMLEIDQVSLGVEELEFLVPQDLDFVGQLDIAKDNANSVVVLLNERSKFHREVIQARLKSANLPQEFNGSRQEVEQIVGRGNLQEIENLTEGLIGSLDRNIPSLLSVCEGLSSRISSAFPELKFELRIEEKGAENV